MPPVFVSSNQERLFNGVRQGLIGLGYKGDDLLRTDYAFGDWFEDSIPRRSVPLAAFGHSPPSYSTACFAVLLREQALGGDSLGFLRALGAPLVFEVTPSGVTQWAIGAGVTKTRKIFAGGSERLARAFEENAKAWSGPEMLRVKNLSIRSPYRQLDLFDYGLIPALESHIRTKLETILRSALIEGIAEYRDHFGDDPDPSQLFRLTFSLLAAKILHDRLGAFPDLTPAEIETVLEQTEEYYKPSGPILDYGPTQRAIANGLWGKVSFENLTVGVLAYLWEHAFVTEADRRRQGIYGTPYELARHVVYSLPEEAVLTDDRLIVEPCCGHGAFLVAALQRIHDLLPPGMSPEDRHERFARVLTGFDNEPFAVEVARLCLSLADFPNRNGWEVREENVFKSNLFEGAIRRAKTVLCNPPFGQFTQEERADYRGPELLATKPAELLRRVLQPQMLPQDGVLGFVLPRKLTDGLGYKSIRRSLAERFDEIEILALPDDVFEKSEVETALLICSRMSSDPTKTRVAFTDLSSTSWSLIRSDYLAPEPDVEVKSVAEAGETLEVFASNRLGEVWARLKTFDKLSDVADVHRGIEWEPLDDVRKGERRGTEYKDRYREKYTSEDDLPGFRPGVRTSKGMKAFLIPRVEYLSFWPEDQHRSHRDTFEYPWDKPKVVVGAARGSRGRWRIKAASDHSRLAFTQRFIAVWPRGRWTPNCLAAVLNGPVASAFVATTEANRDNRTMTIGRIPLPSLTDSEIAEIDKLVANYLELALSPDFPRPTDDQLSRALLRIDAAVLKGYRLPPRLERAVLDYFNGHERPVSHRFGDYFPATFDSTIPLWMYISERFQRSTAANFLEHLPLITDPTLSDAMADME